MRSHACTNEFLTRRLRRFYFRYLRKIFNVFSFFFSVSLIVSFQRPTQKSLTVVSATRCSMQEWVSHLTYCTHTFTHTYTFSTHTKTHAAQTSLFLLALSVLIRHTDIHTRRVFYRNEGRHEICNAWRRGIREKTRVEGAGRHKNQA